MYGDRDLFSECDNSLRWQGNKSRHNMATLATFKDEIQAKTSGDPNVWRKYTENGEVR
jgi:hypothetical protein